MSVTPVLPLMCFFVFFAWKCYFFTAHLSCSLITLRDYACFLFHSMMINSLVWKQRAGRKLCRCIVSLQMSVSLPSPKRVGLLPGLREEGTPSFSSVVQFGKTSCSPL